jgi:lipid-A-disaccharide synthase
LEQKQLVYIVCGEASGDLHAANLVAAWKKINPQLQFKAWGGDRLAAQGVRIEQHISAMSFMGFLEVLLNIRTINAQFKQLKQSLLAQKPDVLVLVDYPGFNLRMARWAHEHGIKVLYYISPTVWAWKQKRVYTIQKYVTKLYCILPFEPEFYDRFGIDVAYFGHPLKDEIEHYQATHNTTTAFSKPVLALLPGSRPQELKKKLPLMLAAAAQFQESHQIAVACAASIPLAVYQTYCEGYDVHLSTGHTYDLLAVAELALVTSGTATLETALFHVPQVVCYKGSAISIWLAKKLVKIQYISLVNLILQQNAVCELIQEACTVENMQAELQKLLPGEPLKQAQLTHYANLQTLLQQSGVSDRIAHSMNTYLPS